MRKLDTKTLKATKAIQYSDLARKAKYLSIPIELTEWNEHEKYKFIKRLQLFSSYAETVDFRVEYYP